MVAGSIQRNLDSGVRLPSDGVIQARISVLVLTHNRAVSLDRCLASLARQSEPPDELIVYVNGSVDHTVDHVRTHYPWVRLIEADRNFGAPGGKNRGIIASRHEWVMCVDDDGTLPADAIARARAAIRRHPDAAIIAGAVRDSFHPPPESLVEGPTFVFRGGICVIRRSIFLKQGGYHEDGLREGEEGELSFRLHDAGEYVYLCPDLVLDHHMEGARPPYRVVFRSSVRQALLTSLRFVPIPALAPWLGWKLCSYIIAARRRDCLGALFLGIWDGLRLASVAWNERKPVQYRTLVASRWYLPPRENRWRADRRETRLRAGEHETR
ncbi:glycosyltransferase [Parafrankia sp. FMc6]|uniref:glycosyltransferase family 2 protein n=1 Tax=Parafrankia soli TaxID=2599596 RepID=UPI0034D44D61